MHARPHPDRSSEGIGRRCSTVLDGHNQCVALRGQFTSISEGGHHHAAAEEAVAGRQRAQVLPASRFFQRSSKELLLSSLSIYN